MFSFMLLPWQWHQLFKGTLLSQRFAKGEPIKSYELDILNNTIAKYRRRLMNISWFMRALNEPGQEHEKLR